MFILASTSPWRRDLLASAGLAFRVEAPSVDEGAISAPDGPRLALARARAKAREVVGRCPGEVVLGVDQVGWWEDDPAAPFGKPADLAHHRAMLRRHRSTPHWLGTALALEAPDRPSEVLVRTRLVARPDVTDAELDAYAASGEGRECAGGYRAEAQGSFLFGAIEGDWHNVVGLPLTALYDLLRRRGWRLQ